MCIPNLKTCFQNRRSCVANLRIYIASKIGCSKDTKMCSPTPRINTSSRRNCISNLRVGLRTEENRSSGSQNPHSRSKNSYPEYKHLCSDLKDFGVPTRRTCKSILRIDVPPCIPSLRGCIPNLKMFKLIN